MPSGYGGGHGSEQLIGIPDLSSYEKLVYPHLDIQDLGSSSHGDLPAKEVKVIRTIKISVPHPVPIKVPHKVPFPVPIVKPYPVHVTKLVEVPHPVPVEVVKKIPVPVEIPKPYPVPQQEYNSQSGSGSSGYDNAWQPSSASGQGYQLPSSGQYEGEGYSGHADQSAGYASVVPAQQNYGEQQQQQQEQQQSYDDGQDHQ
ncbi:PREDICTED: cyclin-dependent kinase inhibitor 1C-like [Nicrophorus vespilloides]|uniref:Cyclin-dependent kinase inhibitor 1C-like n=1 Tax=Nicrophorus vespilloides TaxID=110193 RepID=A0ABM1MES2_NICVS|nr:PREDICTED: cyclin-dependent kinase inhibitor 1C-like [Nicrophorus vespilloides]